MSELKYCICGSRLVSTINGKQICKSCGKEKMPIRAPVIKTKLILPLLFVALLVTSCVQGTRDPDWVRIERDVRIACKIWNNTKAAAVITGLFVPAVSSAVIVSSQFIDPVCQGTAKIDPDTVAWIMDQVERLHALMGE